MRQLCQTRRQIVAKVGAGQRPKSLARIVLAVGRRPNTDDLGLDKAESAAMRRPSSSMTNCNHCPGIWALGVQRQGAFTHRVQRFRDRRRNLLDHDPRRISERITAYALYRPAVGPRWHDLGRGARPGGRRVAGSDR
jgi:pyruvate/2-oxoglutarate dehydrogenase complex dihydrolipoamide dehydrogenase (E3) component